MAIRTELTQERQMLMRAIAQSNQIWTLASLSRALGRNAAYLHQYIHRQSPRLLPEAERYKIASLLHIAHETLQPLSHRQPQDDTISIPFLDIESAAGHASIVDDFAESKQQAWQFTSAIMNKLQHSGTPYLRLLTVRGDSMTPQLEDGDVIMIDLKDNHPEPAGTFVLDDGHGLVVKRLELLTPHDNEAKVKLRICSMNSAYAPYRRAFEDVRIIGRVIWMARAF